MFCKVGTSPTETASFFFLPLDYDLAALILRAMELFTLSEEKALLFHRAIIGMAGEHPDLLVRARAELENLRQRAPGAESILDRWAALLDKPLNDLSAVILADTPDGGLLRANSPLAAALGAGERNAIWRRIGLIQFFHHYLIAVDDLALSAPEQAAITGLDEADLTRWRSDGPGELQIQALERLKQVIALHKSLNGVSDSIDVRRRWLRNTSETFNATPMDLLMGGEIARVVDSLAGAVRLTLGPNDLPQM